MLQLLAVSMRKPIDTLMDPDTNAVVRRQLCWKLETISEMIPGVTCLKAKIRRFQLINLVTPEPIHTSGLSWARIHPKMSVGSLCSAGAVQYLMVSATYASVRKHLCLTLMAISEMIPGVTCLKAKIRRFQLINLVTLEPIYTSGLSWARIHPKMSVGSQYSAGAVRYLLASATYIGIRKHLCLSLRTMSGLIHIDSM